MTKHWKSVLAGLLVALLASPPLSLAQSGCVIPGATTIVQSTSWSPLAADTGKIYRITGTATVTLPATAPTAVWRIQFIVAKGGQLTINPSGLQLDGTVANQVFYSGSNLTISTDGTNYFTSGKAFNVRSCDIVVGDESASALTNAQLGPQKRLCYIPDTATVTEVVVSADAGTPSVIPAVNHAGTVNNLLSAALSTAGSGGIACSNATGTVGRDGATTCSATIQNTAIAPGDYIELVSGTAGGTAKEMSIHVLYLIHNDS